MIYTRKDGTYIIEVNNMPYHVIESDTEKWNEVQQRIKDGEDVQPEIPPSPGNGYEWNIEEQEWKMTISYYKTLKQKEINNIRKEKLKIGFNYNGDQISCDEVSQANANGFLTADTNGLVSYPIKWRTLDNQTIELVDSNELKVFASAMLTYVQSIFQESWNVKDNIENATTEEEINTLYEEYINE